MPDPELTPPPVPPGWPSPAQFGSTYGPPRVPSTVPSGVPAPSPFAAPASSPPTTGVARPATWDEIIEGFAKKYKIDPRLAKSLVQVESSGDPTAVSPAGARGLTQLMPETIARRKVNVNDSADIVRGGLEEFRALLDEHNQDVVQALRRYNASPGAADSVTDAYVQKVLAGVTSKATPAAAATAATPAPPVADPNRPAIPSPTMFEQTLPAGVQEQIDALHATQAAMGTPAKPQTVGSALGEIGAAYNPFTEQGRKGYTESNAAEVGTAVYQGAKHAYNPYTREGRRNLAGTATGIALAPVLIPAGLAGTAIGAIGAGAAASGIGGIAAESGEQLYDYLHGARRSADEIVPAIAGAGGEQAAQDVLGHAVIAPFRWAGRALLGPGVAREAMEGMRAERKVLWKFFRDKINELGQQASDLRFTFGQDTAARTVAGDAALDAARQRAAAAVGAAEQTTTRNVGVASELAHRDAAEEGVAAATAQAERGAGYQQHIGPMPDETAAGAAAGDVYSHTGPAHADLDAIGQAQRAAAQAAPPPNLTAVQDEARRIFNEEILPVVQGLPSRLPDTVPAPTIFSPELNAAMTAEDLAEVASNPVMRTIRSLVNAQHPTFAQAAEFLSALGSKTDFDSPVANKLNGARKKLWGMLRQELGQDARWDQLTRAYDNAHEILTEGYGAAVSKWARTEPGRVVQMIQPDDVLETSRLMATLTQHSPAAAQGVRDAWLYRNVLQGGIEGLAERLRVLHDRPQFAEALLGSTRQHVLDTYGRIADGWTNLVEGSGRAVANTEARGAASVKAATTLGEQRAAAAVEAGQAGVKAAKNQTKTAQRAAQAAKSQTLKVLEDDLRVARIGKQGALTLTAQEELAMKLAREQAEPILNGVFGTTRPTSIRGVVGIVKMLTGPRSADLLKIAAGRPEVSKALVAWLAAPNTQVAYRVLKRIVGQEVEEHGASPALEAIRESQVGKEPPKIGDTPIYSVSPPSPPSPPSFGGITVTGLDTGPPPRR